MRVHTPYNDASYAEDKKARTTYNVVGLRCQLNFLLGDFEGLVEFLNSQSSRRHPLISEPHPATAIIS